MPGRPCRTLRLYDCTTCPALLKDGDHERRTHFALSFAGWTRDEFLLFTELQDRSEFSPAPDDELAARIVALGPKIDEVIGRAEQVWREDAGLMATLANGV